MQILCQPFFLLKPLILCIYYVLKIRRLQCYKYTLALQVFDELAPAGYGLFPLRSLFISTNAGLMNQAPTNYPPASGRGDPSSIFAVSQKLESILSG